MAALRCRQHCCCRHTVLLPCAHMLDYSCESTVSRCVTVRHGAPHRTAPMYCARKKKLEQGFTGKKAGYRASPEKSMLQGSSWTARRMHSSNRTSTARHWSRSSSRARCIQRPTGIADGMSGAWAWACRWFDITVLAQHLPSRMSIHVSMRSSNRASTARRSSSSATFCLSHTAY